MIKFGNAQLNKRAPKREAAYGILFNTKDEIAVIHTPRGYFLPGGGIEAMRAMKRASFGILGKRLAMTSK